MVQNKNLNFIVIDDSKLDCFIAEKVIRNTGMSNLIKSFVDARVALEFINETPFQDGLRTVILVDIQMPIMNGFQFVEAFEKIGDEKTANYSIFVISSSIHDTDLKKVQNYPTVRQFLNKPLNSNILGAVLQQI